MLEQNLKSLLEVRTAGDPDEPDVVWTDLSPSQLAAAAADLGTPVSPPVVRDWLQKQGLRLHQIAKDLAGGETPDRDAQFQRIAALKTEHLDAGNPVFSIDAKAKEHLGQLYRKGRVWTQQAFEQLLLKVQPDRTPLLPPTSAAPVRACCSTRWTPSFA